MTQSRHPARGSLRIAYDALAPFFTQRPSDHVDSPGCRWYQLCVPKAGEVVVGTRLEAPMDTKGGGYSKVS